MKHVPMTNYAASFNPKVWLIRFEIEFSKPIYRLIVTSRNLTFASDYDVAFSTEGLVSNQHNKRNQPLIHFLR